MNVFYAKLVLSLCVALHCFLDKRGKILSLHIRAFNHVCFVIFYILEEFRLIEEVGHKLIGSVGKKRLIRHPSAKQSILL